jgi:tetratricopeptide (TPR) repeat protein
MNNLAAAYWRLKRLDQSIPLLERTLQIQQKRLGRQHPDTQLTVANLGVNYQDAGRLQEAIPLLEEAHRAAQQYPNLRWVVQSLADAYAKGRENAKLTPLLEQQLTEARTALPKDSPQLAGLLAQLGSVLLERQRWTEAEPLLRECLVIREKKEPDAWTTFQTMSLLGGALLGQKKHAEAEPLLLKGCEGLKHREKTIPKGGEARIPEAIDRLIELYTATDRPDEVKKWQAERARSPARMAPPAPETK